MEAWYYPLLHEWPPTGGSHGKPHRTTKILSHAWRCGRVAARGAGAAAGQNPAFPRQRLGTIDAGSLFWGVRTFKSAALGTKAQGRRCPGVIILARHGG